MLRESFMRRIGVSDIFGISNPDHEKSDQEKANDHFVDIATAPLKPFITDRRVEEVMFNRPTELWLKLRNRDERTGYHWDRVELPELTRERIILMINKLANIYKTKNFGPQANPVVTNTLPGGHRFIAGYGPHFQYHNSVPAPDGTTIMVVRQFTQDIKRSLSDYGLKPNQPLATYVTTGHQKADGIDPETQIKNVIKRGESILLSGATGSGKTTLANVLLSSIPMSSRIITVQDTLELNIQQPNHFHILMPRQGSNPHFTYSQVIDVLMRTTPDNIIGSEVSSTNAVSLNEIRKSGHGTFFTTIHANDANSAVNAWIDRMAHTNPGVNNDRERIAAQIKEEMRIIQVNHDKFTNQRFIAEIS